MTTAITETDIRNAPNKKVLQEYAKTYKIKNYSRITRQELETKLIEAIKEPAPQEETKKETPQEFFNRVSKIIDESELKAECEKLLEILGTEKLQPKSKSNKLRPYARRFKELTPSSCDLPKEIFFAFKAKGKSVAIDRHKFFEFTGLAEIDWDDVAEGIKERKAQRTGKARVKDELADALNEESKVFSLDKYIATMTLLLNSNDPWENAIGLIAASGRRPFEIMIGGNFQSVDNSPEYLPYSEYSVQVDGLAKKRDKNPTTIVPLLIPTNEFLFGIEKFRNNPEILNLKKDYEKLIEYGANPTDAAHKIEDKFGKPLRRITEEYFSFIPKIDDGQNRKNILLRACTMKIITLRDKPNISTRARLKYAGLIAGHVIPIFNDNGGVSFDGKVSSATLNYDDYEPDTSDIPLLENIVKIESMIQTTDLVQIAELKQIIRELEQELLAKEAEIKVLKEKMEYRKLELPEPEAMDNRMLFSSRKVGSGEEKLNRAWKAITAYNDDVAEYKLNPTNPILRQITGVNGQTVKKWIDEHRVMYDDHIHKHGFDSYYNNRYRGKTDMNVEIILKRIEKEYLNLYEG